MESRGEPDTREELNIVVRGVPKLLIAIPGAVATGAPALAYAPLGAIVLCRFEEEIVLVLFAARPPGATFLGAVVRTKPPARNAFVPASVPPFTLATGLTRANLLVVAFTK
jgi:hypothetical protein